MHKPNKTFLICLFVYCVVVKMLPFALVHAGMDIHSDAVYPWSFTPIFAFGIFGVSMFRNLKLAFGLPVLAWLAADLLIGFVTGLKYGFQEGLAYACYPGQIFQYLGLVVACSCGGLVRQSRSWGTVLAAATLAPTLFFFVSNFGVWAFDMGIGYTRDLAGLQQAYVAAIPFYRNQLLSTLGFSLVLFSPVGLRQLLQPVVPAKRVTAAAESAQTLR